MFQLRCTQKVQKELGLKPDDICDVRNPDSLLGNWYVNLFVVDRRKTFLFMNERTFLSFIAFGIRKSNVQKMPELFLRGLDEVLTLEGFGMPAINDAFAGYGSIELTKTDSRSMLGNMKDLTDLYKHFILSEGGFNNCDLKRIISKINRMPQRNLGWSNSVEVARELLRGNTNMPHNKSLKRTPKADAA
jgi:hypothetical protein